MTKSKIIKNDEGKIVPETCSKCGGKVVCQIHGEPVYVCKDCGEYYGTMPFSLKENKIIMKINESQLRKIISESIKNAIDEDESVEARNWVMQYEKIRNLAFNDNINKDDVISKLVTLCDYAKDNWVNLYL